MKRALTVELDGKLCIAMHGLILYAYMCFMLIHQRVHEQFYELVKYGHLVDFRKTHDGYARFGNGHQLKKTAGYTQDLHGNNCQG